MNALLAFCWHLAWEMLAWLLRALGNPRARGGAGRRRRR
jgi:hypothetical protein